MAVAAGGSMKPLNKLMILLAAPKKGFKDKEDRAEMRKGKKPSKAEEKREMSPDRSRAGAKKVKV